MNASKPDLIALLGDYTAHPDDLENRNAHRDAVAAVLTLGEGASSCGTGMKAGTIARPGPMCETAWHHRTGE